MTLIRSVFWHVPIITWVTDTCKHLDHNRLCASPSLFSVDLVCVASAQGLVDPHFPDCQHTWLHYPESLVWLSCNFLQLPSFQQLQRGVWLVRLTCTPVIALKQSADGVYKRPNTRRCKESSLVTVCVWETLVYSSIHVCLVTVAFLWGTHYHYMGSNKL